MKVPYPEIKLEAQRPLVPKKLAQGQTYPGELKNAQSLFSLLKNWQFFILPRMAILLHLFEGLLPRPLPDGRPVLDGPLRGPLFLPILSPPLFFEIS